MNLHFNRLFLLLNRWKVRLNQTNWRHKLNRYPFICYQHIFYTLSYCCNRFFCWDVVFFRILYYDHTIICLMLREIIISVKIRKNQLPTNRYIFYFLCPQKEFWKSLTKYWVKLKCLCYLCINFDKHSVVCWKDILET